VQTDFTLGLNDEQKRAVETTDGPLLILAGAGSGKTKTLTHRIAYLIAQHKATPNNILAVTFTNKAAREMRERVAKLLGQNPDNRMFMPYLGTFHSICVRLLRQDGEHIGVPRNFIIFDDSDQQSAIKRAIKELKLDEKSFTPRAIGSIISTAKSELSDPGTYIEFASGPIQRAAVQVYPIYEKLLKDAGALDFDDLLVKTVNLLESNEQVRNKWRQQFAYIMVDEYQDTNTAQYKLMKLLANKNKNIAVVGDDWQCLTEGTLVETPQGNKKIEEITEGEVVKSASGYGTNKYFKVLAKKRYKFDGEVVNIKTASGKEIKCTPNHILFSRWIQNDSYFVYLMHSTTHGYRIGTAKGTRFDGKKHDIGLRVRANQERADKIWVLKICKDRQEAIYYEALYSYKYGIPMMVFHAYANRYMKLSQEYIDAIYKAIDTESRVKLLASDLGVALEYPHFVPQATIRNNQKTIKLNVVLFGDRRIGKNSWAASRMSINTSNKNDLKIFKDLGYAVRTGRAGTYRAEVQYHDYSKIEELLEKVKLVKSDEMQIEKYSFLTNSKFTYTPASQIHLSMALPSLNEGVISEDPITSINKEQYSGYVYDLDIENVHNYIASGIVVHNSIYSWRGADFKNILNFETDYPNATVIKLEQNYRSTETILEAAHAVIAKNSLRSDKKLWTSKGKGAPVHVLQLFNERAEAEAIATRIQNAVDARLCQYEDFAILYRMNAQSRAIEDVFVRYGLPYRMVGGLRFYDRKEIKDILAYMRLIYQPEDRISFERIVNVPTRSVGAKSLADFFVWQNANQLSLQTALSKVSDHPSLTQKAKQGLGDLNNILEVSRNLVNEVGVSSLLDGLLRRLNYYNYLNDGTIQGETRVENVKELISVTKDYQDLGLDGFLEEVALVSDLDNWDNSGNNVTLMTLHAAKGLEFPVVFMAGMEETIFPHSKALYDQSEMEEERRLCYVGMTRAKRELYLTYATSRLLFGGILHNVPSRFISDIDGQFETDPYSPADTWQNYSQPVPPPAQDEIRYVPELVEGDTIRHKIFGVGTVVEISGDNVVVYFKNRGAKKLNLAFAPIEKL